MTTPVDAVGRGTLCRVRDGVVDREELKRGTERLAGFTVEDE